MRISTATFAEALNISTPTANLWVEPLNNVMDIYHISDSTDSIAMFLSQIAHESAGFSSLVENLNYSAGGLANTWPARYAVRTAVVTPPAGMRAPNSRAQLLHRKPIEIANDAYASRMGNGEASSGDGWKYRGRGLLCITGKAMYRSCGDGIGLDLVKNPDLLLEPDAAARSAGWFWYTKGIASLVPDIGKVTKAINGGLNGLADRRARYVHALSIIEASV